MDPITIATLALGVSALGTGLSAVGSYRQGQAQAAAYEYNAQVTERKAAQEEVNARDRLRKLMSTQRALYAKAGVDLSSGSPLLALSETAAEGEKEILAVRTGAKETADLDRFYARNARLAGGLSAGSTLLTGLGSTGLNYYQMKKS